MTKIGLSATILLFLAVLMGAFGTHILQESVSAERMNVYQVAVRYQFYFGLGILFLYLLSLLKQDMKLKMVFVFMLTGTIIFCLSLYTIVFAELFGADWAFMGAATPFGGVLMMLSWLLLAVQIGRDAKSKL